MPNIKELQQQIAKASADAKALYAEMEADEAKRTSDNREKLDEMLEAGQELKADLRRAQEVENLDAFVNEPAGQKAFELSPAGNDGPAAQPFKSWGHAFTESEEYKFAQKSAFKEPKVEGVEVKAIYESTAATGGAAIFPTRRADITDRVPTAPTTLLDIMNVSPTDSSSIDYVVVTGYTNSAAEVSEYTGGNFGAKPESNLTFALENAPVQTIAHWIAASRNVLADAPRLRNMIDTKLINGLRRRLEGQVVAGDGIAPNLKGIRNASGIQTRSGAVGSGSARFAAGDTILDTIRRAITDVALAFGQADAVVVHPGDGEKLELMKDDNNNYMNVYDPVAQRVWRVRVVENLAMTLNRGLVGDFSMGATLYMRENAVVRVSESHSDFFIRNAIVILAELRAALAVTDPELFVDVNTLT
jgi:HK97 family phage major capsid protein